MPAKVRTGLVPVDLLWFGEPLAEPAWVRVTSPGPAVPRLASFSDGVNLLSGSTITTRSVKLFMEELAAPEKLEVSVDGTKIADLDLFCTDPVNERFEVNFQLPASAGTGKHRVEMRLGSRVFPPVAIDVVG